MASGRPPSHVRRLGNGPRSPRLGRAAIHIMASFLAVSICLSCASRGSRFISARHELDAALSGPIGGASRESLFLAAARDAKRPAEWLSLLARARSSEIQGDSGRYEALADRALAAEKSSSDLAVAAVDAYLRAGRAEKALALFPSRILPEDKPGLWAEAFLSALRLGRLPASLDLPANYSRLAEILGEPRFLVDAALLSLASGDRLAASSWIEKALAKGVDLASAVLWDLGRTDLLSARPDDGAGPSDLRLMADASWQRGEKDEALRRWTRALAMDPKGSWRTYVSLASLSRLARDPKALAQEAADFSFLEPLARELPAKSLGGRGKKASGLGGNDYYDRMLAAFPRSIGARSAYAAALVREGRAAEAQPFLELGALESSLSGDRREERRQLLDRLSVGSYVWPEKRLVAEAIRLVDSHPADAIVLEATLGILLARGYFEDFLVLFDLGARRGATYGLEPLYKAFAMTARGEAGADKALEAASVRPSSRGPSALYAAALLHERRGEVEAAQADLRAALPLADKPTERCAIYKEIGGLLEAAGEMKEAREAYDFAAQADPSDTEAARLSHR